MAETDTGTTEQAATRKPAADKKAEAALERDRKAALRDNEDARDAIDALAPPEGQRVVASISDNRDTEHTFSGATTRQDTTDQGVPVRQGPHEDEPIGPEDALGRGGKRGDYTHPARLGAGVASHESVPLPGGGAPIHDKDGNVLDYAPISALEPQAPRAEDSSAIPAGHKGGVGAVGAAASGPDHTVNA